MLTTIDYNFLKENEIQLGNVKSTKELIAKFFNIYNKITGENKAISGCGRCILTVKKRLRIEVIQYENR